MTNWEKQMAEKLEQAKMERTRTYADAIEALRSFGDDIEYKQMRIDTRYAQGKTEGLTKLMERDLAKERKHLEGMIFMVSYMFDMDQADVIADLG